MSPASALVLPAADYYVAALRAGVDPFQKLARFADETDFATCGIIELEVCRGFRDPALRESFRARFSTLVRVQLGPAIIDRATLLGAELDRSSPVLPAAKLFVAASALHLDATLLTTDVAYFAIPGLRVIPALG